MLKVIMTMGDAMGNASDNEPTKAETYYYDTDNIEKLDEIFQDY